MIYEIHNVDIFNIKSVFINIMQTMWKSHDNLYQNIISRTTHKRY